MLLYFDLKLFRLPELVTCKIGTIIYNVHKFCFHRLQIVGEELETLIYA